ncbi:hypothetical protein ACE1BS_15885 [Aeromonas jandaei]
MNDINVGDLVSFSERSHLMQVQFVDGDRITCAVHVDPKQVRVETFNLSCLVPYEGHRDVEPDIQLTELNVQGSVCWPYASSMHMQVNFIDGERVTCLLDDFSSLTFNIKCLAPVRTNATEFVINW